MEGYEKTLGRIYRNGTLNQYSCFSDSYESICLKSWVKVKLYVESTTSDLFYEEPKINKIIFLQGKSIKQHWHYVLVIGIGENLTQESFQLQTRISFPFSRANNLCTSLLTMRARILTLFYVGDTYEKLVYTW